MTHILLDFVNTMMRFYILVEDQAFLTVNKYVNEIISEIGNCYKENTSDWIQGDWRTKES